jgi:hypothetical protein
MLQITKSLIGAFHKKTHAIIFLIFVVAFIFSACSNNLTSNQMDLDSSAWVLTVIDNGTTIIGIRASSFPQEQVG